jgi:cell division protein FtsW (lipid II flippase)
VIFLAAYGVTRGRVGLMLCGATLLAAGFYVGYRLGISSTLVDRMRMWQGPWDNIARGGDQIAQALWSMSSGGLFGAGLGLGDTRFLPAGHTDLVLCFWSPPSTRQSSVAPCRSRSRLRTISVSFSRRSWRSPWPCRHC